MSLEVAVMETSLLISVWRETQLWFLSRAVDEGTEASLSPRGGWVVHFSGAGDGHGWCQEWKPGTQPPSSGELSLNQYQNGEQEKRGVVMKNYLARRNSRILTF